MEFSIKFDKFKSGVPLTVYIEGLQVVTSKKYISFSEDQFCLTVTANSAEPDKMPLKRHFICVFTVCHSTSLEVSSRKRANSQKWPASTL